MRDMEAAIETISYCRRMASEYRQLGFLALADYHKTNATAAEKWLIHAGKIYPQRCPI